MNSPYQLIGERFESEQVQSVLAIYAAGSEAPLCEPGSGAVLGMMMFDIGWGIKRPVGGMQALSDALAACLRHHGGEARPASPVEQVLVDGAGRACGVRLEDGEELRARQVIGALDPYTLIGLIEYDLVPEQTRRELDVMRVNGWNVNNTKIDVALERRPDLLCERPELWGSYMLLGPGVDYVERAIATAMRGEIPTETPMSAMMPTSADRTQLPTGSGGDSLHLFCTSVPHELADGRRWADHRAGARGAGDRVRRGVRPRDPRRRDRLMGKKPR